MKSFAITACQCEGKFLRHISYTDQPSIMTHQESELLTVL